MLYHLMELHPDIGMTPIPEDFLVSESNDLVRFARRVGRRWAPFWREERQSEDVICDFLGRGLLDLLQLLKRGNPRARLFTKTPSVENISLFRKFFPGRRLVILIRDGRSVAASLMQGMHVSFDEAVSRWVEGARLILEFTADPDTPPENVIVVKYEDLVEHTEIELIRIFGFLGLNTDQYDFEAAAELPVFGSSFFQGTRPGPLHWDPVAKTDDFRPLDRWDGWSRTRHRRFNRVAGTYMTAFGYPLTHHDATGFGSCLRNTAYDLWWQAARARRLPGRILAAITTESRIGRWRS